MCASAEVQKMILHTISSSSSYSNSEIAMKTEMCGKMEKENQVLSEVINSFHISNS